MKISGIGKASLNTSQNRANGRKPINIDTQHKEGSLLIEALSQLALLPEVDEQRVLVVRRALQKGGILLDVEKIATAMVIWHRSRGTAW
ncbi:hypothetical protein [Erwinia oleae]|uniref:hypothetical protein n=1 Tax=Erwinia oleae TaxID=796334 RepID=UPI000552BD80|nr:hypothetical protein [Erwinia oleae]